MDEETLFAYTQTQDTDTDTKERTTDTPGDERESACQHAPALPCALLKAAYGSDWPLAPFEKTASMPLAPALALALAPHRPADMHAV